MPKVSVIVPTYNRPEFLKKALDSILNQSYQDFEIIVVDDGEEKNQSSALAIANEVDRIYTNVNNELIIDDRSFNRQIVITSTNNKTTVIWNPWIDICAKMPDLAYDDYQRFICVEPGNVDTDIVEIPPGGQYHLITNFKIIRN